MPRDDTVELKWILAVIRRRWWLVVGCTLVAAIVALAVTSRMPPSYQARVTLLVALPSDSQASEYSALMAGQQLALTYSQMLKNASTLGPVITRLGLAETPESLARRITTESVKDTQLVRVTVADRSPTRAAQIADAVASVFTSYIRTLEKDRSATYLADMSARVAAQLKQAEDTQSKIDDLSTQQITDQAEVSRLETVLANYRSDYRALQANQQALRLAANQVSAAVRIVEPARLAGGANEPPFTATATLLLDQARASGQPSAASGQASEQVTSTYAQVLGGFSVLQAAIEDLALAESPEALAQRVKVEPVAGTQLFSVSATGDDAAQATRLADALARNAVDQAQAALAKPYTDQLATVDDQLGTWSTLIDWTQGQSDALTSATRARDIERSRLQTLVTEQRSAYLTLVQSYDQAGLAAARSADKVTIIENAAVPAKPATSRALYILIAAAIAGALGLGTAFMIERLNDVVRVPEDVQSGLGLRLLAQIQMLPQGEDGLVRALQPATAAAEAFRMLAMRLRFAESPGRLRTVLVTSPCADDGKSVVVANLAPALAMTGLRVIAVDGDLRAPRLHEFFGLPQDNGLTEALGQGGLNGNLQHTGLAGVKFLSSGALPADPASTAHSPQLAQLLAEVGRDADVVLIDSAPLLPVVDAAVLASMVDGVLLVLRTNRSRTEDARQAAEVLAAADAHLIGVVLNAVPVQHDASYSRYFRMPSEKKGSAHWLARLRPGPRPAIAHQEPGLLSGVSPEQPAPASEEPDLRHLPVNTPAEQRPPSEAPELECLAASLVPDQRPATRPRGRAGGPGKVSSRRGGGPVKEGGAARSVEQH